jgi:hypothetical protein
MSEHGQKVKEMLDKRDDEITRLRAEVDALSHNLGELLAVLHGDGGHYRSTHGDDKATADAIKNIYADYLETERLRAEIERLKHSLYLCHLYAECTADNCRLDGDGCYAALKEQP